MTRLRWRRIAAALLLSAAIAAPITWYCDAPSVPSELRASKLRLALARHKAILPLDAMLVQHLTRIHLADDENLSFDARDVVFNFVFPSSCAGEALGFEVGPGRGEWAGLDGKETSTNSALHVEQVERSSACRLELQVLSGLEAGTRAAPRSYPVGETGITLLFRSTPVVIGRTRFAAIEGELAAPSSEGSLFGTAPRGTHFSLSSELLQLVSLDVVITDDGRSVMNVTLDPERSAAPVAAQLNHADAIRRWWGKHFAVRYFEALGPVMGLLALL